MALATKLSPRPPIKTGGQVFAAGARGDVQDAINACVNGRGDKVTLPPQTLAVQARMYGKTDVTLDLAPSTKITGPGTGDVGVYLYKSDRVRVSGTGEISVPDADGIGIYSGQDHHVIGPKIHDNGGQGVLVNQSDGDTPMTGIWIEGIEAWNNGKPTAFAGGSEPGYWRFGCHSIYFGGGRTSYAGGVLYGNHIHDQHAGYGTQAGGEVHGLIIAASLYERCDGAAAGGVDSDRNARGIQIYSSYSESMDILIVSNLFRDCLGAWVGTGPAEAGVQGTARKNVYWNSGELDEFWGDQHGLTNGGNTRADMKSIAEALAAGYLDPAFIDGSPPIPNPTPTPTGPVKITQSINPNSILVGHIHWMADTDDHSRTASVDFLVDDKVVHTEMDYPYGNGDAPSSDAGDYDTAKLADGSHKLSAQAHITDNSVVRVDASVTVRNAVTPPPPPVKTNTQLRDEAVASLAKTTETYATWNKRTAAKKIGTQWKKALDLLAQIKD